ncbi:MAG: LysM peptidoglycan-binding domain-containing protein [Anaerolineales bacterium]
MKSLRQVFFGIVVALASIGLLLGGFLLSLAEGKITTLSTSSPTPTPTLMPTSSPTWQPLTPSLGSLTPTPTWTITQTPSLLPPPTNCPPPVGWLPYIVQAGDTLDGIAARYQVSIAALQHANCLLTPGLLPGVVIYVPPVPTQTPVPCGPPYLWIVYIVQPGDTLYHLSQAYGITVAQLQAANCMGDSTLLHTGQALYVPPWAMHTPTPTVPGLTTPTSAPVYTPYPTLPSDTPYPTLPTNTPYPTLPTNTPPEISTNTPIETPTPMMSDTPIEVPTETPKTSTP